MARYRRQHRPVYYVQEPTDFGNDPCGQREPTMETAVMADKKEENPWLLQKSPRRPSGLTWTRTFNVN